MDEFESLSHTKWECKYHVVFIPKFRRKALYGQLRDHLGELLRKLAIQKESRIEEGHLMPDHVHMMISIPPKYAVSQVIGYVKGKSAIHLARVYGERRRNFVGQHFWARGSGRQNDHRHARPPDAPLRHHRDRQHQLSIQKPKLTKPSPAPSHGLLLVGAQEPPTALRSAQRQGRCATGTGPSYALR